MIVAQWSDFFGCIPRIAANRLATGYGEDATDMRPGSADLRGWNASTTVKTTSYGGTLISAWRFGRSVISDTNDWVRWPTDVDVVRSLIANDTSEEIYYTGDGGYPKRTDNVIGLPASPLPAASRYLGIKKPATAMTVAILVDGTGDTESRVYVDTYVNDQGRESAPGLTATLSCKGGATASISSLDTTSNSGRVDITLRRIYVSTNGGPYLKIIEQSVATSTATDNATRTTTVLDTGGDASKPAQEEPPASLKGLISLWGGMVGGFFGKNYAVCEPNRPWAWPVEYQDTLPDDIVASAKYLSNWLLLTDAQPYLVNGGSPLALQDSPTEFPHSCQSKRGVVSFGHGVCWPGMEGLCYLGQGKSAVITEPFLSQEQWLSMQPSTMIGARYERFYLCFFNDGTPRGFLIDPLDPKGIIWLTQQAVGQLFDPVSNRLYLLQSNNSIQRFNTYGASAMQCSFSTKVERAPYPTNPCYGVVIADEPVSCGFVLKAKVLQADGTSVWTTVSSQTLVSGRPFALPAGYLSQEFKAVITTTGPVQGIVLVDDPEDLP